MYIKYTELRNSSMNVYRNNTQPLTFFSFYTFRIGDKYDVAKGKLSSLQYIRPIHLKVYRALKVSVEVS